MRPPTVPEPSSGRAKHCLSRLGELSPVSLAGWQIGGTPCLQRVHPWPCPRQRSQPRGHFRHFRHSGSYFSLSLGSTFFVQHTPGQREGCFQRAKIGPVLCLMRKYLCPCQRRGCSSQILDRGGCPEVRPPATLSPKVFPPPAKSFYRTATAVLYRKPRFLGDLISQMRCADETRPRLRVPQHAPRISQAIVATVCITRVLVPIARAPLTTRRRLQSLPVSQATRRQPRHQASQVL